MVSINLERQRVGIADEFGPVAYKAEDGIRAATMIGQLQPRTLLEMDFERVDGIGLRFISTALSGLTEVIGRLRDETPMLVVTNANEDIEYSFDTYLHVNRLPLSAVAFSKNKCVGLLTPATHIASTFDVAKRLTSQEGAFTVAQLAESLSIKVPNTNHR